MKIKSAGDFDLFRRLDEIDGELQDFHISAYKCDLLYKEQDKGMFYTLEAPPIA